MVSTIDIPFRFSVLTEGQGVKPVATPLHPNIGQKSPAPLPLPATRGHGSSDFEVLICRTSICNQNMERSNSKATPITLRARAIKTTA